MRVTSARRATLSRSVLLVALLVAACVRPAQAPDAAHQDAARPAAKGRVTNHVLIISIDGLRPDAIERFNAATLQRLMQEGAYSRDAQTILPSTTLPSHTSMLTGVDVDVHGVIWNSDETSHRGPLTVPTVFGLAHVAGFRTAAFFGKGKLQQLHVPRTLDYVRALETRVSWYGSARRTVTDVGRYLAEEDPNLLFIHLAEPDYAGHLFGWMGRSYERAVIEADRAVGLLIQRADARFGPRHYTLIVTADHGGHGRTHGTADPADTTIPWIVWGEGVRSGTTLAAVHTTDTAATALWLLGVAVPAQWTGRPVAEAFDTTAAAPVP
jgi:predicted AlkP superfamily pyrophosphatase or phosphodiesterase